MRNHSLPIVLAAAGVIGGIIGFTVYAKENESPFAFGTARAGVAFDAMNDDSQRHQGRRFTCTPIGGSHRLCAVATDGPDGRMVVAVNAAGRAMVVAMTVTDSSPRVANLTQTVYGQWNKVGAGVPQVEGTAMATTWRSADGRWSARMRMRPLGRVMERITITDERALATIEGRDLGSVVALMRLARHGLVSDTLLTAIGTRTPDILRLAADSLTATARRRAWEASKMDRCQPAYEPTNGPGGADPAEVVVAPRDSLLHRLVAEAYPGLWLEATNRFYLASASGRGEPIELTDPVYDASGTRAAIAVTFAGRVDTIASRAEIADTRLSCRSGVDVIVARIDTVTGAVSLFRRFELEHEALAVRAKSLRFVVEDDSTSRLVASYEATYADDNWFGTVDWDATFPADGYIARVRRPTSFVKREGAHETRGTIAPDSAAPSSGDAMSGRRITVLLSETGGEPRPLAVVMPSALKGAPSGWMLLAMF